VIEEQLINLKIQGNLEFFCLPLSQSHHKLNLLKSFNEYFDSATMSYTVVHMVFIGILSYIPSFFGGKSQSEALWLYHRILGYLLLITLLNIAELGVQAGFMVNHIPRPNLLWLYWVSLAVMLVAIGKRTDASRCG
jgi:hypothetical protein